MPYALGEGCAFNPLCTCRRSLHEVVCRGVPFAEFPVLPRTDAIYQVTIIRSGLEVLHHKFLEGSSIASLHLMHNNLAYISQKAFIGLESILTTLDLSHNKLYDSCLMSLVPLKNLEWLNLKGNNLEVLRVQTWANMGFRDRLTSLFLGSNQLTHVPEGVFTEFTSLGLLDLDGNLIHDVDSQPFPSSLQSLSLANNLLKKVPLHAIYSLKKLRFLYLSGNLIRKLPCPFHLHTSNLDKLELSNNILTQVPEYAFNGSFTIKELHLDFNFIRVLGDRCFKGTNLERLVLSNNRISAIYFDAFNGVERTLKTLDLSFNLIEEFPLAVNGLKSLLYLSLKSNLLGSLDANALQGFSRTLEMLDLSGNLLIEVPRSTMKHMKKLVRLSLQDNRIRTIQKEDFEDWGGTLTMLSLANNGITNLPEGSFSHLQKLKELKLSFNNIISVSYNIFEPLQKTLEVLDLSSAFASPHCSIDILVKNLINLEWLQLDQNNISKVSATSLNFMSKIRHLDFSNNDINEVPVDLFVSSKHMYLSTIKFGNNEIKTIKSGTFWNIQHVSTIVLFGNAISNVEDDAFAHCTYLHTIILPNNNLSSIAPSAFHNLSRLSNLFLQDNVLEVFSLDAIEGDTMQLYLNLSNNALRDLKPKGNDTVFNVKVKTLDLTKNNISVISNPFMVSVSKYLVYLFLSKNLVKNISFPMMPVLQVLDMSCNKILGLSSNDLKCCPHVQILSLDHNIISHISYEAFDSLKSLRVLDLSNNRISTLPENLFTHTRLERLNLTGNNLLELSLHATYNTLRTLDLSHNHLSNISSINITGLSRLQALNLSSNHISFLEDDSFHNLSHLLELDLSNNPLKKITNESFSTLANLFTLKLGNTSLEHIISLPFPRLQTLVLRNNRLRNISQMVFQVFDDELRHLDLSSNLLTDVPSCLWPKTIHLTSLDISRNQIEALRAGSFAGLDKLQALDMGGLALKKLDPRTLHGLRFLQSLHTNSYASVRTFRLQDLLSKSLGVRKVTLTVEESTLSHQLQGAFGTKLRELSVSGKRLVRILPDAFAGLTTHELTIRISGTPLKKLPDGLLKYLPDVRYLTLDLRNNDLREMRPEVLGMVTRSGYVVGQTQHISGGVLLENNPWRCSCDLLWLGKWLRRWLRETFHLHMLSAEAELYVNGMARKATCSLPINNNSLASIIDIKEADLNCYKNSTSGGGRTTLLPSFVVFGVFVRIVMIILIADGR
ncbi:hypothetical protein JTE90_004887 [Oedothorax gibbosus]|uniref:Chaoptin n=1 Tax=Oedothorax gibbosus TaxID=931172 RepID=A0AAV6USR1_9ARAC|nr:hypothetical protein JTE90_004887 [Oedothorax gibbosus]